MPRKYPAATHSRQGTASPICDLVPNSHNTDSRFRHSSFNHLDLIRHSSFEFRHSETPMQITTLTTRLHSRRYESNLRNSRHPWKEKHALLVFVTTDTGITGVGEAWTENASPLPLALFIEKDLAPLVLNQPLNNLPDIETLSARLLETDAMSNKGGFLYAAASAIDIAFHDALARSLNLPLYQLLAQSPGDTPSRSIENRKSKIPLFPFTPAAACTAKATPPPHSPTTWPPPSTKVTAASKSKPAAPPSK